MTLWPSLARAKERPRIMSPKPPTLANGANSGVAMRIFIRFLKLTSRQVEARIKRRML